MKKTAALFCLVSLIATSAFAVVNPDPDIMGMYWDLNADMPCMQPMAAPINLYIILTNPSMDAIAGFECGFTMDATVTPYILGVIFPNPTGIDWPGFQNFIIPFNDPVICTEATLLATINVGNFAGVPVDFYLHNSNPPSIPGDLPVLLLTDDSLMQVSTPNPGGITALQAVDCAVATDNTSWDSIKSLYR